MAVLTLEVTSDKGWWCGICWFGVAMPSQEHRYLHTRVYAHLREHGIATGDSTGGLDRLHGHYGPMSEWILR